MRPQGEFKQYATVPAILFPSNTDKSETVFWSLMFHLSYPDLVILFQGDSARDSAALYRGCFRVNCLVMGIIEKFIYKLFKTYIVLFFGILKYYSLGEKILIYE